MSRSQTRRSAVIYAVLQVAAVALALWLSKHFAVARLSATLIALAPTVPASFLAWAAYRDDRRDAAADIDTKVETLATAVAAAETRQRAQLIGPGAHHIDVAFHRHTEPANNATGAAPHGRLTDIVTYYQDLRPARLAITGEPGAGKTLLALELILGLLTHPGRTNTDPVPVRFSLASWNTDRPLPEWLAHQLHEQFRDRGITLADAAALVEQHRVLPVLDGLDEMDTDATPAGRRRAARAVEHLNAYQDPTGNAPVVLTCRTTQYEDLAALNRRMREAARIQLDPVTTRQAAAYLTARSMSPDRWTSVIDTFRTAPDGTLARALATPWRLNLAVTAYEEQHPDTLAYLREPNHLLTLASPTAVREHLLALYLPAAARQHSTRPSQFHPDQAHQWLAELATHLALITPASTTSGTDIVLHQLWPMAGPRRVRTIDALLAAILTFALTTLLLSGTLSGFSPHLPVAASAAALPALSAFWYASRAVVPDPQTFQLQRLRSPTQRRQLTQTLAGVFKVGLVFGLVGALVVGFASRLVVGLTGTLLSGLAGGLVVGLAGGLLFGLPGGLPGGLRGGLAGGLKVGLKVGLAGGLAFGFAGGLKVGLAGGLVVGLPFGFAVGYAGGLANGLGATLSDAPPIDPRHPVRDNLVFGLAGALLVGLAGGLTFGLTYGLAHGFANEFADGFPVSFAIGFAEGLLGGLVYGLAAGLVAGLYLLAGAGRRYLIFLCCIRGRLPWHLGTFLNWAYEAGLLRVSGVAYQFRHRELQDWLTGHPTP